MAEMKFSCARCGQHISGDESWSSRQIQCPACGNALVVPSVQPPPGPALLAPEPLAPQAPEPSQPRLSAGATQVTRPAPRGALPQKKPQWRPARTGNPLLKLGAIAVLLAVVGGVAYTYLPGWLGQPPETGASKTPAPAAAPTGGGTGPLGEMNGAMDVSDALDGGSASQPPAGPARKPAVAPSSITAATNPAARPARRP